MTLPPTNLLIHGDNQEVLDALRSTHRETIQLVYIDPPYNTGLAVRGDQQTKGYRDRQNSTDWLREMSARFEGLHELLKDSGSLMVQLDENEVDAAKLALDEIFGRNNFINRWSSCCYRFRPTRCYFNNFTLYSKLLFSKCWCYRY